MDEEIRKRAYEIYLWRCSTWIFNYGQIGDSQGDWYQAEKEIENQRRAEIVGISPANRLEKYY